MTYPFANDIFISYAHNDNLGGWVDRFQENLLNRLTELQVKVKIWRDRKLGGADKFSDEIFDQLRQSALLVSIVSPSSVLSHWCQDEWKKFEEFAQDNGGFQIGNKIRALKVVKTPLDDDTHRPLFETIGYEFCVRDKQSGRIREYSPSHQEYQDLVFDCAQEIRDILKILRTLPDAKPVPGVFVAGTHSDLEPERTRISREIIDWKCRVYPSGPLAVAGLDLRSTIAAQLAKSLFSVHIVGEKRDASPENEEKPLTVIQYELADAQKLDRIVWVPPGSKLHPSFGAALAAGSQQGLDYSEGSSIESLKSDLGKKLDNLKTKAVSPSKTAQNRLSLYVVCDRNDHPYVENAIDRENALKLKSFLESEGFVLSYPPLSAAAKRELQRDHHNTLRDSNAVVLYWGAANELWFRENLRDLNAARSRRRRPFAAEAIYFSQPLCNAKAQYYRHVTIVLEEFDGFEPDKLRPLLDQLRSGREGFA